MYTQKYISDISSEVKTKAYDRYVSDENRAIVDDIQALLEDHFSCLPIGWNYDTNYKSYSKNLKKAVYSQYMASQPAGSLLGFLLPIIIKGILSFLISEWLKKIWGH